MLVFSKVPEHNVARTAFTRRRSGWGARLAAFLSSLGFALAVGIEAIQDYSYEIRAELLGWRRQ
jgi:hypothetical protein